MKSRSVSQTLALALLGGSLGLALSINAIAQENPVNIALGKTVTFSAAPDYSLSTDPDDIKQLTDGQYSSIGPTKLVENTRAIWVQKGTVGWQKVSPLGITIDLGSIQPISGVSYSTAAGQSDVTWPRAIYMLVSDDNKTWHFAGDLLRLSRKTGLPPKEGYANFRYITHDLQTRGRYILFSVIHVPYAFVDEIEVYRGDDAWLNQPFKGAPISDLKQWSKEAIVPTLAFNRVQLDADAIREAVQASNLMAAQKSAYTARIDKAVEEAGKIETVPDDFKAILPLNDSHRDLFATHGDFLASQGYQPLTVWKQHRYQWLPVVDRPNSQEPTQLRISMLRNQFRTDALLLTNASGKAQTAALQLNDAPRGVQNGWLQVSSVAWTDTAQSVAVADALLPVEPRVGRYEIDVPAGMTRKVWFTIDSSKVTPGSYNSNIEVTSGGRKSIVPFSLSVASVAMKKPRMGLSTWDYTNIPTYSGLTLQNRKAAMELMRSHFVDTVWATGVALPQPEASDFDTQGNLKNKIDFSNFDQWVKLWPDARRYFVYPAVGDSIGGVKMNTPGFDERVKSWAKVIVAHIKELGLQPQQVGLLLVDEPHRDEQDERIIAWAKPINEVAPELTLFQDPIWLRPDQTKNQAAITEADLICFHIPVFKAGGPEVKAYAEKLRQSGKELWLYQATGPIRLYDPQLSYRHLAWHSYAIGGKGQGYWSFGDTGGVQTSWNEYAADYVTYAPVFVGRETINNSLHWDATREGVEDFEELSMLQDAINASNDTAWKQQAQQVLNEAVNAVDNTWDGNRDWQKKNIDPTVADQQLQKVRDLLVKNAG